MFFILFNTFVNVVVIKSLKPYHGKVLEITICAIKYDLILGFSHLYTVFVSDLIKSFI